MSYNVNIAAQSNNYIDARSCPFCGASAKIYRELNCDTLCVDHTSGCFIRSGNIRRFHWNGLEDRPALPFSDWNFLAETTKEIT